MADSKATRHRIEVVFDVDGDEDAEAIGGHVRAAIESQGGRVFYSRMGRNTRWASQEDVKELPAAKPKPAAKAPAKKSAKKRARR